MQIFISGSLAYDRIMSFPGKFSDHILPDKIHILNVCFMVGGLQEKFGGTAGNIAYTLRLLEEFPTILGAGGSDFARYEEHLKNQGLSLEGVRIIEEEFTAGAYITTDAGDNQITAFNPGAMNHPSLFDFEGVDPKDSLAIVSPGSLEDMRTYSRIYKEKGIRHIFDPGQSITAFSGPELIEMLDGCQILISNDYELELIQQATGLTRTDLEAKTGALITTLGEHGSMVVQDGVETRIPASPVEAVKDPTGAGDALRAGLIKGLASGLNLIDAAKLGATSAAYAVEQYGTQEHKFTLDEFQARHNSVFG